MKCMNISVILVAVSVLLSISCSYHTETANKSNKTNPGTCRIAFYNTENLFDIIDDVHTNDNDFLPEGKLNWTAERYELKLKHIKDVMNGLNESGSLALLGMAEVENKEVLEDLLRSDTSTSFKIIHFNSSDKRGIDVSLLYNDAYFTPLTSYLSYFDKDENPELFLREVLVVKGILWSDTVHVLVNHWPSRREGEEKSEHKRIAAAMLTQEIIDSIITVNPASNIIVMGDFNDQPSNESMSVMLKLKTTKKNVNGDLINPYKALQDAGKGTCKYKRDWFLFDQILVSNSIMNKKGIQFLDAEIFNPEWLYYKNDLKSGPFRTYLGNKYYGGYSDHFPVYIELKK